MEKANLRPSRSSFRNRALLAAHMGIKEDTNLKLLNLFFSESDSHFNQALTLFEGLDSKEQEALLTLFPQTEKDGVTEWAGDVGLNRIKNRREIEIDNQTFNIGFLLHAIANPTKMKKIKAARIWTVGAFTADFLQHLQTLSSAELQFSVPQQNGYFSITTKNFNAEVKKLIGLKKTDKKPLELSVQNFQLIDWKNFPNVQHLRLIGDLKEEVPKFSELILEADEAENYGYLLWRNWYSDQRATYTITKDNFPNLKTLTIENDVIGGRLSVSAPKIEEIALSNLSSLVKLSVDSSIQKLQIQDCKNIRRMDINTKKLASYQLSPALETRAYETANLGSQKTIAAYFKKQNENHINIVDDAVYSAWFEGEYEHLSLEDGLVEMYHYETSLPNLIEHIKYKFNTENDNYEHHTTREVLFSDDFDFDMDCTISSGYNFDYYDMAEGWKNHACSVELEVHCSGKTYKHKKDSADYELLVEQIPEAINIYSPYLGGLILEYLSPKQVKELAALYRKLNPED